MATNQHWSKRAFDVVVASVALLVAVPAMLVLAVVAAIALRTANPFFVHDRIGRDGVRFRFVKIRTLPPTVGRYQDKHSVDHQTVPTVLRLIRLMHLDELPQLLLVLRGSMSLVGPRPEMPNLHESLDPTFARIRTSVRPGLTCLWQVSPDCTGEIGERPEYDMLYVRHRTLALDVWILWATIGKVLFTRTVPLHQVPRWTASVGATGDEPTPMRQPATTLVD